MAKRYLPKAFFRGNEYSRRIVDVDDGRRLIVSKIRGGNAHATCSQVAARSIPRGWRRSTQRETRYVGSADYRSHPGNGFPTFERDGHAISVPIERMHA
jgi:hypothetical protein